MLALAGESVNEQRFEILDTPGPNEAGTRILQEKVNRLLENVDVIIYLLDYTKLGGNDEEEMLKTLGEMRLELLNDNRAFFVVNKIDMENSKAPSQNQIADYVVRQLRQAIPKLVITPERVLLVSAQQALLARLVQFNKVSDDVQGANYGALADFKKMAFGFIGAEAATLEDCQRVVPNILRRSKIEELEKNVLGTIWKNRASIYFKALLEDLNRHYSLFYNNLETRHKTLEADQRDLRKKVEDLTRKLKTILQGLEKISRDANDFEGEIYDLIDSSFDLLAREITSSINAVFAPRGLIQAVQAKFQQFQDTFFKRVPSKLNEDFASQQAAQEATEKLNDAIANYLINVSEKNMADLESLIQQKQRELFRKLKVYSDNLSREIQDAVSQVIQVPLYPVTVSFKRPSREQFHEAMSKMTREALEKQERTETKTEFKWGKERSWSFFGFKIKKWPGWVTNEITKDTKYRISAQQIKAFWSSEVNKMLNASQAAVTETINGQIRTEIRTVNSELKRFSDGYVATIEKSMEEAKRQDKEQIIKMVKQRKQAVEDLLKDVQRLQKALVD